ncbi:exodeoxyribonuclease V subunit beta [Pokkaliibacter sp. CJK22405]|uniref:exodeoxyribonuclease V subunit beta n=1 Tax=Pokkaliibacter sp. CJK22405 TaxID=3384615 RepID=UPI0039848B52
MSITPLEPLTFPLWGTRLIEASAGTGKTFTIAALYVRLVLGHGVTAEAAEHASAFARPLTPPEILVVTFTDAATKELRDRIRARLTEAASAFLDEHPEPDPFLISLRNEYPVEQWGGCARKLQLAAEWMDEAAVSTIHGWCNRMLSEHAFDSGSLFTQTLETDLTELFDEAVRDYWRSFYYPLSAEASSEIHKRWPEPALLGKQVKNLLSYHSSTEQSIDTPQAVLARVMSERQSALAALKAPWQSWTDELFALLAQACEQKLVDGRKLRVATFSKWFDNLREWVNAPEMVKPDFTDSAWNRLSYSGLADAWKDPSALPDHPAIRAINDLQGALADLPDATTDLLRHATQWTRARFDQEKQRRALMGFDDLLTQLDAALAGPNGERLAQLIRQQFPVAMIDEFQDTDPVQYRLFDRIYQVSANAPERGLILIGDPKQAIYAFRGADIFTYLQARQDTVGRHYTLGTNFRSSTAMVAAVNQVFDQAEHNPLGDGAFLFRRDDANPVPFTPVAAKGRKEVLEIDGLPAAALQLWSLPYNSDKALSRAAYVTTFAKRCAVAIAELLMAAEEGRALFRQPDGAAVAVTPGDIAVLVNTGSEASKLRTALRAHDVKSVYLSDKESVFDTSEAAEVEIWLAACAEPENERFIRAALGTPSLGLAFAELDRLNHEERAWEARVEQFRQFRDQWRRQGVLPMLRHLLHSFAVPQRLLSLEQERSLTNILHLAELLQQQSSLLEGEQGLLRYLAEQREESFADSDARKLRLESDEALVKVVTVHKSKGLEYPLVFLPFACAFRPTDPRQLPLSWHDEHGKAQLAFSADEADIVAVDQERLGEDLRKFYVALTRARHATWMSMAPVADLERSAPGYLLAGGEVLNQNNLDNLLQARWADGEGENITLAPVPEESGRAYRSSQVSAALNEARVPVQHPGLRWWITSYSGIDVESHHEALPLTSAAEANLAEGYLHQNFEQPEVVVPAPQAMSLHAFERGAEPGTFLHGLLEWVAEAGFTEVLHQQEALRDIIARRCQVRGWDSWIEPLFQWLKKLLQTPLRLPDAVAETGAVASTTSAPATQGQLDLFGMTEEEPIPSAATSEAVSLCLNELTEYQMEMEFWFSLHSAQTTQLDDILHRYLMPGQSRPSLRPQTLNGMLKGFIDLTFLHDGRYYVLDYKSNWLGPDERAYTREAMEEAMLSHRYDLQYALYIFALHRLLSARQPDYDYDQHMGGAVYLFLRGTEAQTAGCFVDIPPKAMVEAMEQLFADEAEELSA